jgi:hypothetical protein
MATIDEKIQELKAALFDTLAQQEKLEMQKKQFLQMLNNLEKQKQELDRKEKEAPKDKKEADKK